MKKYELYNNTKIIYETPDDGYSYFFGYYDKPSLNKDNTKLLTHRVAFDGRDVQDGDIAEVGYIDLEKNKFIKIDETLAWNWQQGSQLQWLPPEYDNKIIYNSIKDNKFVSIIYDLNTKEKKIIPFPIYVVHPNGKEALGVNYERHYWCRHGYNYQNIKNKKWDKPYHEEDGIFKIDLENGEVERIINIVDIINTDKLNEFEYCNNWLEYMMYNPNGDRFMFFHRWAKDGVDLTRLYIANSNDGKELINFPDIKFYSHSCWKNNEVLSIWSKDFDSLNNSTIKKVDNIRSNILVKIFIRPIYRLLKPLIPKKVINNIQVEGKHYNLFDKIKNYNDCFSDVLNKVAKFGHQRWYKDERYLLTDSYQDKDNYRWLYILDTKTSKLKKLVKFYSTYNDCGYRADLHPRLSVDEKHITIDSVHDKKRKQIILEITRKANGNI